MVSKDEVQMFLDRIDIEIHVKEKEAKHLMMLKCIRFAMEDSLAPKVRSTV